MTPEHGLVAAQGFEGSELQTPGLEVTVSKFLRQLVVLGCVLLDKAVTPVEATSNSSHHSGRLVLRELAPSCRLCMSSPWIWNSSVSMLVERGSRHRTEASLATTSEKAGPRLAFGIEGRFKDVVVAGVLQQDDDCLGRQTVTNSILPERALPSAPHENQGRAKPRVETRAPAVREAYLGDFIAS